MYYLPEPPYFLFVFGFFAAIASGLAFEASLKQKVKEYFDDPAAEIEDRLKGLKISVPFLGICAGVCLFLGAGLEVFGISALVSYAIAFSLTILMGSLIWSQLAKLLWQLQQGGSRSIDLDA